jgi:hypothetical protein
MRLAASMHASASFDFPEVMDGLATTDGPSDNLLTSSYMRNGLETSMTA